MIFKSTTQKNETNADQNLNGYKARQIAVNRLINNRSAYEIILLEAHNRLK